MVINGSTVTAKIEIKFAYTVASVAERLPAEDTEDPMCLKAGKLLPVKSNQKMNAYLKEIADVCGITKTLTTHIARHMFATAVTLVYTLLS